LSHKCLQKEIGKRVRPGSLRFFASDVRGSELFEFAMVLPVLAMLLIGAVWIGRAMMVYQALGRAARDGARAALATTCASCGNARTSNSDVTTIVTKDLKAASLDTSSLTPPTVKRNQVLDPGVPAKYQDSGVTVTVTYPVKLYIPFTPWNGTKITLSSTVSMRQEF
jgi:Flp pilus assembly protein TadG